MDLQCDCLGSQIKPQLSVFGCRSALKGMSLASTAGAVNPIASNYLKRDWPACFLIDGPYSSASLTNGSYRTAATNISVAVRGLPGTPTALAVRSPRTQLWANVGQRDIQAGKASSLSAPSMFPEAKLILCLLDQSLSFPHDLPKLAAACLCSPSFTHWMRPFQCEVRASRHAWQRNRCLVPEQS